MQLHRTSSTRLLAGLALCVAVVGCATSPGQRPNDFAAAGAEVGPWDRAALQDLATYVQSQKTTGFLIMEDRKVVYEHNWPLAAADTNFAANWTHGTDRYGALQEDVASAQKSFIALLAGIAVDKGLLDIDKAVSDYAGPGWSKASPAQEAAIRVRYLLEMNSGLTEKLAFEAPAGTKFFYNTPAYAVLMRVLQAASKHSLDEITRAWLTVPAGLADTEWRRRPSSFGDVGNPMGLYTTPRDLARLGQLLLDKGVAGNGNRVISEGQLAAIFTRSSTNPAYGRLWWLNGSSYSLRYGGRRVETALVPAAPADLIMAFGALERRLYVSPSRKLIVVRTGQAAPDKDFDQQLWLLVMKATTKR